MIYFNKIAENKFKIHKNKYYKFKNYHTNVKVCKRKYLR